MSTHDENFDYRLVWAFESEPLTDAEQVRTLWRRALGACGQEPNAYDLNQRGQWREFDADGLIIDTLTQRTQLVMVRLSGGGMLALSTGKHGERPRLFAQLSATEAGRVQLEAKLEAASAQMIAEGSANFANLDRQAPSETAPMTWWVAAAGARPDSWEELRGLLPSDQAESTPWGWQVRVCPDELSPPQRAAWQGLAGALSARYLT